MKLRFINRDGKKILQQESEKQSPSLPTFWEDVPTEHDNPEILPMEPKKLDDKTCDHIGVQ